MKIGKLFLLFTLLSLFASCGMEDRFMELSGEKNISIARYDRLQSEYVRFNSLSALQKMNTTYSHPTQILIEDILTIGQVSDEDINQRLTTFFSDTTLVRLMNDVQEKFVDLNNLEKQLNAGFKKLLKEVPELKIPRIYTQISALNESIIITDSLMGISLDKYMGEDYPLYHRYYYEHQRRSMRPDRIAPDCFSFYLFSYYPVPYTNRGTLLEMMIHTGKINYVVQQILGYSSTEDAMGYTAEEKKWCKDNKSRVWEYMRSGRQLYTTDPMIIRRYIRPTPFIEFFGENSPGLIGVWMGTEIVSNYMKNNKKVSIAELLKMTDYSPLLREAEFTP